MEDQAERIVEDNLRVVASSIRRDLKFIKAQLEGAGEYPLFVSEAEIARRLGISVTRWKAARGTLEARGLRRRDPLLKMRYWPAVKAFFDNRAGLCDQLLDQASISWDEDLDALAPGRGRRRSG